MDSETEQKIQSALANLMQNRTAIVVAHRLATARNADRILVLRDGRLEKRSVETGLTNWRNTEVTSGLAEGELVVTSRDSTGVKAGARAEARAVP